MKNIVVLCPTIRDRREIGQISREREYDHNYIFYGDNPRENLGEFDPLLFLEGFRKRFKETAVDGIMGTHDYPASILASILGEELELNVPETISNLVCQHKYFSRVYQERSVPQAVPRFSLIDISKGRYAVPGDLPVFLKPVKSFFSILARKVESPEEFHEYVRDFRKHNKDFSRPFEMLLENWPLLEKGASCILAEELMQGKQVTLEGYVCRGKLGIIGITDSIMYPGTISFKRFEYPSRLPEDVQKRMAEISKTFMGSIGFDNGMFNIEFFYNHKDDSIKIIEVNPRMASQFADLVEKVDGMNSYKIQVDISLGRDPGFSKEKGKDRYAASFVLRSFEDKKILKLPGRDEIKRALEIYPEARIEIYGKEGEYLSQKMQDMQSYRYGIINLGGDSRLELMGKYKACLDLLKFEFH